MRVSQSHHYLDRFFKENIIKLKDVFNLETIFKSRIMNEQLSGRQLNNSEKSGDVMHERLSALLSNYIAICRFEILQKNKRKKKGVTKIDR